MPISPTASSASRTTAGFTLVELLAAIVIVALAASTVTLGFSRRPDRNSVSALAAETASLARSTRALAVETGRDAVLVVDLERRTVLSRAAVRPLAIPPDMDLEVIAAMQERAGPGVSGIRFYPDGASTGGTIRLGHSGMSHEVRINWFTGRIQVVPPS